MTTNTVFDQATVQPPGGNANTVGTREFPPYNENWEAIYEANLELVARGQFPDSITTCGTPAGFPRMMNLPAGIEFVVRPEQFWIITEDGPNVMRVYTDGRDAPSAGRPLADLQLANRSAIGRTVRLSSRPSASRPT